MPKKVVSFSLSDKTIKWIGKLCSALGLSRSQFIENTIQNFDVQDIIYEIRDLQIKAREMILGEA